MTRKIVASREERPALRSRHSSAPEPPLAVAAAAATPAAVATLGKQPSKVSPAGAAPSPPAAKSSGCVAGGEWYIPEPVFEAKVARSVQARGRKKETAPRWTERARAHYPDVAMEDALQRLQPAADKSRLKGSSVFAKPDIVAVCKAVNEYYSVPEKGWISELKWTTLRDHAEAKLAGQTYWF